MLMSRRLMNHTLAGKSRFDLLVKLTTYNWWGSSIEDARRFVFGASIIHAYIILPKSDFRGTVRSDGQLQLREPRENEEDLI